MTNTKLSLLLLEEFEHTIGVIRFHKSKKDRQHNVKTVDHTTIVKTLHKV